jgi:hypothetical protein
MSVRNEFVRWVGHIRRLGLPVAEMLLPGLDAVDVRNQLANLGLDCSDDLTELYGVSGGVCAREGELLNRMWMYGSHYMLPFDRAVEDYKLFRKDLRWNKAWFPIFGNDGGDFYSFCSLKHRDDWRKICYFTLGTGDEPQVRFSSLENMLAVINECFDRGVCSVDQHGNLSTNFFEASVIAMGHNRNLPFYQ